MKQGAEAERQRFIHNDEDEVELFKISAADDGRMSMNGVCSSY